MFIELDNNIFDDIEKIDDPWDERIGIINGLFTCMCNRKHIVYASRRNLKKLEDHPLINPQVKSLVKWLQRDHIKVYGIRTYLPIISSPNLLIL